MHNIITKGRQLGKSTLETDLLKQQINALSKSIDRMIIDELWDSPNYSLYKTWRDRRGRQMHRISANNEVRQWLETEHNQYGVANPEWWKFEGYINITDKLYTLLVLRFAE